MRFYVVKPFFNLAQKISLLNKYIYIRGKEKRNSTIKNSVSIPDNISGQIKCIFDW